MGDAASKQKARQIMRLKEDTPESLKLAKEFEGVLQNFGCHASAVVIVPSEPSEFFAIERQKDNVTGEIRYVAAYDFHDLEAMGILKQDILGLKTADVISDTINKIKEDCDIDFDIDNLPEADEQSFKMLCEGKTSGCFQIESYGMTDTVRRIQPKEFADLIPLVAIYRPGPKDAKLTGTDYTMLDAFIMRRSGELPLEYVHPKLEPILKDTYGIIIYQEQILQIAKDLCGYTLGEADMLRRIIGRKQTELIEAKMEEFVARGIANGIDEATMREISDQIITFANYGFNKGHSTAYGYIAYQTAYLKCHYPLQFMWALINSEENTQEKIIPYVDECSKMNIKVLNPDLRYSQNKWEIENGGLRVGISYIKFVGDIYSDDFVLGSNFIDCISNNHWNKRVSEGLIKAGALDFHGVARKEMLKYVLHLEVDKQKNSDNIDADKNKIIELKNTLAVTKSTLKKYASIETQIKNREEHIIKQNAKLDSLLELEQELENYNSVQGETDVLGFYVGRLKLYDFSETQPYNPEVILNQVIGGEVVKYKEWMTKKNKVMAFVSFKTEEGTYELVAFDRFMKNYTLKQGNVYILAVYDGKIVDAKEALLK